MATLNIVGGRVAEGWAEGGVIPFTVTLSEPVTETVTVRYRTLSGTASEGVDYNSAENTLTFAPGETTKTIGVRQEAVRADGVLEPDESVVLELFNAVNAQLPIGAASLLGTGWILDGDTLGNARALQVSSPVVRERDGSVVNATFTISLSRSFDEDVTLRYRTVAGSATAAEDFVARTGTFQILAGQTDATINVRIPGDNIAESAESFSLVVTPIAGIASGGAGAVGKATILDDDTPSGLPSVSIIGEAVQEGWAAGGPVDFRVFLNAPATETVTVNYRTAPGTATSGVDFNALSGRLTFNPGESSKTVSVRQEAVRSDGLNEVDESIVLELFDPLNAEFGGGQRTVRGTSWILDGDGGNNLAVFVSSPSVVEPKADGSTFAVFDVDLSRPSDTRIVLSYETRSSGSANAASAGADFQSKSGKLTFDPGQTRASVKVKILPDERQEAAEDFLLRILPPLPIQFVNTSAGSVGTATIADASLVTSAAVSTVVGTASPDVMFGLSGKDDTLFGLGGDDRLEGRSGDDQLEGGDGKDRLYGGAGKDTLNGGRHADRMEGGGGDDTFVVDNRGDVVVEAKDAGKDLVRSQITYKLGANVENLNLIGTKAINGTGNGLDNVLRGNGAANTLNGGDGDDRLLGGAGKDVLIGGLGADTMTGDAGADRFVFRTLKESKPGSARDKILDFTAQDEIDLSAIDANTERSGNQKFKYIGTAAFSDTAGELRFRSELLEADVDGDGRADFRVALEDVTRLSVNDIVL